MTTKSSGKVTADEVIDLVYSLKRPYRKNAVFLANDVCVAELRKLKDSTDSICGSPLCRRVSLTVCWVTRFTPLHISLSLLLARPQSHSVTSVTTTSVTVALVLLRN